VKKVIDQRREFTSGVVLRPLIVQTGRYHLSVKRFHGNAKGPDASRTLFQVQPNAAEFLAPRVVMDEAWIKPAYGT
jgi:hypothetical protein